MISYIFHQSYSSIYVDLDSNDSCLEDWIVRNFIILYLKLTMHTSFQSTTYKHSLQAQNIGPSSLKIFDGEDLSK